VKATTNRPVYDTKMSAVGRNADIPKKKKCITKSCCTVGGKTPWADEKGVPGSTLKRTEAKYFSTLSDTNRKCETTVPSVDKHRLFYEKREIFLLLGKYMNEYNLDSTRIFNAD